MALARSSLRTVSTLLLFAICVVDLSALAQQPKVFAPHRPILPRIDKPIKSLTPSMHRTMVGGLWMIDANFKASIYLRNIVETDPVAVTPVLYLSNGAKYQLTEVTVRPAGIAIISINDELGKEGHISLGNSQRIRGAPIYMGLGSILRQRP